MGRSGGCCNFQHSANSTAPPCPEGSCCYIEGTIDTSNTLDISLKLDSFKCEDNFTENCCLTKPSSLFNKGVECGQPETCEDQSSFTLPSVYSTDKAFILLKQDGTVVTWGDSQTGGEIPSIVQSYLTNIVSIYTNPVAVVAVSKSGHAFTWGDISIGSGSGSTTLFTHGGFITYFENIKSVTGSARAFAAIRTDGTVVAWGEAGYGGVIPSSISSLLVNIVEIVSTDKYFAARDEDGKIFIWGDGEKSYDKRDVNKNGSVTVEDVLSILNFLGRYGADIPSFNTLAEYEAWIEANPEAVASVYNSGLDVNKDGRVSTLDILIILNALSVVGGFSAVYDSGFTDIKKIYSNNHAFAFLKKDGVVHVWGDENWGGENKGGNTGGHQPSLVNIKEIYNTDQAFLAHRTDNKIVVWGDIDTTVGPASTFYDEVLDVVASKYAFGISYIVTSNDSSLSTEVGAPVTRADQYFDVIGLCAPDSTATYGRRNRALRLKIQQTTDNPNEPYVQNLQLPIIDISNGGKKPYYLTSSYSTIDHNNPQVNIYGDTPRFKRDFYASDYAFHFRSFLWKLDDSQVGSWLTHFYLVGQPPDDEHSHHTLIMSQRPGVVLSNNFRLANTPALYDIQTETLNSAKVENSKNYVSSSRATAFLVNGDGHWWEASKTREGLSGSERSRLSYVMSIGHIDYGGLGTSLLLLENTQINPLPPNSVGNKGDFVGLFSNQHSFCGIRFLDDLEYEIVTWGNQDFGGNSSSVDFSNTFANTSNLKISYEGCHEDFCDQDVT